MPLDEYKRKRNFKKTSEPRARRKAGGRNSLSFVVQEHHASHLHWDFRLELDGVLKSWAVPKGPTMDVEVKRLAMEVEDHPLSYGSFEGEIPKGNYGAGQVFIWDNGTYEPQGGEKNKKRNEKIMREMLENGRATFFLHGKKLRGLFALIRTKTDPTPLKLRGAQREKSSWLLFKKTESTKSKMKTGQHMVLTKTAILKNVKPMLATAFDMPFDSEEWIFEPKWDGYRAIAEIDKGKIRLYSRNNLDFTKKYKSITKELQKVKHDAVLDGEIVALDENGKTSFLSLQDFERINAPLIYYVFDLLYLDGYDLRKVPLIERKKTLQKLLPKNSIIKLSEHIERDGKKFFEKMKKEGMEGMIAKDARSSYETGKRSMSWLKIKNILEQEAIICGITEGRKGRKRFGALILGAYANNKLVYIGHTGGGFTEAGLEDTFKKLKPYITSKCPFEKVPKTNEKATWLQPKIVCQVKFREWTKNGSMRHPIFLGLREDKKAKEVTIEREKPTEEMKKEIELLPEAELRTKKKKSAPEGIFFQNNSFEREKTPTNNFTNIDKIFFPKAKITKGDVIGYYEKIADFILPYLKDRPLSLRRNPNGIAEEGFFQKNVEELNLPDFVHSEKIWSESNKKEIEFALCQNKESLLYLANLGCIEFNPWNSRVGSLDNPDYAILDLDPGERSWKELIEVALGFHKLLDKIGAPHFVKTSGKKGLHILIPLEENRTYDDARDFAKLLCLLIQKQFSKTTSLERVPAKRGGKIYLDFLQNRRGQTLACPYSIRPVPEASVATPLEWKEVSPKLDQKKSNMKTVPKRLEQKGDPWKNYLQKKLNLAKVLKKLADGEQL